MKVGNLVNGLAVIDVKRITSLNLTAFTRDIVKYLDEGYRIDISSTREVGLQKRVDMFKVESNLSGDVGSVGDNSGIEPNETTVEALQESVENLEIVENFDKVLEEATNEKPVDGSAEDSETPVKKPTQRSKKTT